MEVTKLEKSGAFFGVLALECRGFEPEQFVLEKSGPFKAEGTTGHVFEKIEFDGGDWADYDEDADKSVTIMNFSSKFVRG